MHHLLMYKNISMLPKWFTYSFYVNLTVNSLSQQVCLSVLLR